MNNNNVSYQDNYNNKDNNINKDNKHKYYYQ